MFTFTNVIHIIIIFQGVLLALYILASNPKKNKADQFLALIIGTMALQVLGLFLANRGIGQSFFQSANCAYGFLYGPLLLLYIKHLTQRHFVFSSKQLLHLLPFFGMCIGILVTEGSLCQSEIYLVYVVHILTYVFLCFLEVSRYKQVVRDNYSRLEWLNLGWLYWVFVVFCLIVLVDIAQLVIFFVGYDSFLLENSVFILMLIAINLLYFYGFTASRKPFGYSQDDLDFSAALSSRKRINTTLDENQKLIEKLENHIKNEEPYKNFNLTIATLADEIAIPKRKLSELINDHYDQNFVDFINTFRISKAKERFMNPTDQNETILEVLYEVGFNSKSSFNSAFKKKTGITPSEFKSKFKP